MTKLLEVAIVIVGLTLGSAIAWAEQAPSTQQLDSFMRLENLEGPFVTKAFAEELAILVLREKYPKRLFVGGRPCEVADSGDIWLVTVRNKLPQKAGQLIPKRFVVHIRKTNGEIVTIS